MNKKRNVDSGRKSARPDYIQKTISQKSSGKRSGKVFFPKTLIKTGGIIIFVLLLGFAGNKFFLSVSKTDSGKVKAVSASGADEEKEGRIIEKTKKTKEIKETKVSCTMERAYKFRIYPDAEQEKLIQKTLGCVCFVYNHYLDKRIELYKTEAKSLGYNACSADLTELKKQIVWLKEVDATALQASLRIWTLRTRTSSVA